MRTIIRGVSALLGEELEFVKEVDIEIEDGRIREIGSPKSKGLELDGSSLLAFPGLIDAHTHIGDSVAKELGLGSSLEELVHPSTGLKAKVLRETPEDVLAEHISDSLLQMLRCGITTFADFREGGLRGVELLKRAASKASPHPIILGRPSGPISLKGGGLEPKAEEELVGILRASNGLGLSGANEFSDEALSQIYRIAYKEGKGIAIHAAESPRAVERSKREYGKTEVERILDFLEPSFLVHLTNPEPKDLSLLESHKTPVVCCPRANSVLGVGIPNIPKLLELGIPVALGTDNVMLNSPDMLREMDFTSKVIRGYLKEPKAIDSLDVLKMATVNGAKALGIAKDAGTLEEGKRADIVFMDTNSPSIKPMNDPIGSIVHRASSSDIIATMVGGGFLYGGLKPLQ